MYIFLCLKSDLTKFCMFVNITKMQIFDNMKFDLISYDNNLDLRSYMDIFYPCFKRNLAQNYDDAFRKLM